MSSIASIRHVGVALVFVGAYLAGVLGLVCFSLMVLDLGDPLFRHAVQFYFVVWSVLFSPAVVSAYVFLLRSRLEGSRWWRLAAVYLALIFVTVEVSAIFDVNWRVLLAAFPLLLFLFWRIQRSIVARSATIPVAAAP